MRKNRMCGALTQKSTGFERANVPFGTVKRPGGPNGQPGLFCCML